MRASPSIRRGRSPDLPEIYFALIAAACLLTGTVAFADTTWVAGGSVSGSWTSEGSPYMILGDLRVPPSQFLSIGPGVTVFFAVRCSLLVDSAARLEAIGAEDDSIYFTTDTLMLPERWAGIALRAHADTCRMEWCVVENGDHDRGLIRTRYHYTFLDISHSTFRKNTSSGAPGVLNLYNTRFDISECVFEHNRASGAAAILITDVRGTIQNCLFRNNQAVDSGGAIACPDQQDTLVLRNCQFESNTAARGGAVLQRWGDPRGFPRFEECRFVNNIATVNGGAASTGSGFGGFRFIRCWFEGNQAPEGGALFARSVATLIDQCVFRYNSATEGGAIYLPVGADVPPIQRCTIVSNTATSEGGGIWLDEENLEVPTVIYATIIAFNTGGGLRLPGSWAWPAIRFNLLYGNAGGEVLPANNPLGHFATFNHNDDSADVNYNIVIDPQFVDTAASDYHLLPTSPCIDGTSPYIDFPHDPDGTDADIGAFYYDQSQAAEEPERTAMRSYQLNQNYPNPFNAVTRIEFDLPRAGNVELNVFDLTGRRVAKLINQPLLAGHHTAIFDATALPSGVYFYHLRANDAAQTRKMVLLK